MINWAKFIWSAPRIPKCSFIVWLVWNRKLYTKDRLFQWGITRENLCSFCNSSVESIELRSCKFTEELWKNIFKALCINRDPLPWRREVSWFCRRSKGSSILCKYRKIAFTVTVYMIWIARNESG